MVRSGVYIIRKGSSLLFKIGISKDPVRRIQQLQTGCPDKLYLTFFTFCLSPSKIESALHTYFHKKRSASENEWFNLTCEEVIGIQVFLIYWANHSELKPELLHYSLETPPIKTRSQLIEQVNYFQAVVENLDAL